MCCTRDSASAKVWLDDFAKLWILLTRRSATDSHNDIYIESQQTFA